MALWDIFGGVDPGASGALALIMPDGSVHIFDYLVGPVKTKWVNSECYDMLAGLKRMGYKVKVVIEKSEPRQPTSLKNAFAMGGYYRDWTVWHFERLGLSYDVEIPTTWQKVVFDVGARPRKVKLSNPFKGKMTEEKKAEFKKMKERRSREHSKKLKLASIERAKRLYPGAADLITRHDRAEALLIAHFCWLKYH